MTVKLNRWIQSSLALTALGTVSMPAPSARAHIDLDAAGTHMSRSGGEAIKAAPCGAAGSVRGDNIYTYKPGSTITISLAEYVSHPGYFRIAFDNDGTGDFLTPVSITGEHGACAGDPKCGPGMEDFCNNDTVLIDNLDPHPGLGFSAGPTYTWTLTLPNVECDNCTLQIIQVMTDLNVHLAPYPADDIYYNCIDLVLSNDATNESDAPIANNGIDCTEGDPVAGAGGMTGGTGGMMMTGGAGGMMMMTGGAGGMMMTGGAGGMTATTGGTGGTATGGASGAAGAAGMVGGAGGAAGAVAGVGAAGSSGEDDSGCAAAGPLQTKNLLSALLPLGLALLLVRRRRQA